MIPDLRGPNCPMPALRTRKMLCLLAHGDTLIVECADPLAVTDIPHLPQETGDTLERQDAANGLSIYIQYQTRKSMGAIFSPVVRRCSGIPRRRPSPAL